MRKHGFAVALALVVAFMAAVIGLTNVSKQNAVPQPKSAVDAKTAWSPQLSLHWNYRVYTPKGYSDAENAGRRYPVVYMLHGWGGNVTNMTDSARIDSKATLDSLIDDGKIQPMIVVFVDGFNSYYVDGPALKMESAITRDLVPLVDSQYRTLATRDKRAIGGISMGGYGALNLALGHQDLFCAAGLMSPALWDGALPDIAAIGGSPLEEAYRSHSYENAIANAASTSTAIFIHQGLADQVVNVGSVENCAKLASQRGFTVSYSTMEKGPHTWATWKTMYPQVLEELSDAFGK